MIWWSSSVMFEIEVLNFVDIKVADDFENYTKEQKEKTTLDELITVANAIREVGRELYD